MSLTNNQADMFDDVLELLRQYGTGQYRADLPRALGLVAAQFDEDDAINPLQGLVLHAAARRLDEIDRDGGRAGRLADELRDFKHKQGG